MGEQAGHDDGTMEDEVPQQDAHEVLLEKWGLVPPTPETGRRRERSAQLRDDPKLREVRRHIGLGSRAGWRRSSISSKPNRPRTGELGMTLDGPGFRTPTAASATMTLGSTLLLPSPTSAGSALPSPMASATQGMQNFVTQPASAMAFTGRNSGLGVTHGSAAGTTRTPAAKGSATSFKRTQTQPVNNINSEDTLTRLMEGTTGQGLSRSMTQPCLAGTLRLDSTANLGSTLKLGATSMLPSLLEETSALEPSSQVFQVSEGQQGDAKQQYRAATNAAIQRLLEDIQLSRGPLLEQKMHGMVCDRLDHVHEFYSRFGIEPQKVRRSPPQAAPQFLTYDPGAPAMPGSLRGRDVCSSHSPARQQRGLARSRATSGLPSQAPVQQLAH